jgi:hypothetical protein
VGADALTVAVSAAGLSVIRFRKQDRDSRAGGPVGISSIRHGLLAGIRFIWQQPVLRALTILMTLITFLSLGLTDVFVYYVRHGLHQGQQAVGVILGLASCGAILAAILAPVLRRWAGFGGCWLGSYILCGMSVVFLGLSSNLVAVATAVTVFFFSETLAGVCSKTLRQEITPDHLLGRVTSAFWTLQSVLGPVGAAVITFAVGKAGIKLPMVTVGLAFLAIIVAGLMTPIRQRQPDAVATGSA